MSHREIYQVMLEAAKRIDELEEVMKWYADEGNYCSDENGNLVATAYQNNKVGNKAREVLAKRLKDWKK